MATFIGSICRGATKTDDKLNILTFPTHERYEQGLAKTGHNFYAWRGKGIKDWKDIYAPRPPNYILLNNGQIPLELDLDLILCQNKFGQYPIADRLSRELHLPIVSLEHTLPMPEWSNKLDMFKNMRGHVNVFISEYNKEQWEWNKNNTIVIHHGIDTDIFYNNSSETKETHVLSVVNDFINRDWCCGYNLWQQVTQGLPNKVLGDTPGLSKPAASIAELVDSYRKCKVFLNTSLISPVPTVLLEAMACGCAVVSTDTCMIPNIITDGYNGLLGKNAAELREKVGVLLEDDELAAKLGKTARQTICENFSMDKFVTSWQSVFASASNIIYTGTPNEN